MPLNIFEWAAYVSAGHNTTKYHNYYEISRRSALFAGPTNPKIGEIINRSLGPRLASDMAKIERLAGLC